MGKLAKQGDTHAIAVLIEIMTNATLPSLREEVLDSVAFIGAHCDHTKNAIVAQLQQPDASVRIAALQAFSHFAASNPQKSIGTMSECLEDEVEAARFQAVQVLTDVAATGHADVVVWEAKKRLGHASGGVRRAGVQALTSIIAQGGDQSACAEITFLPQLADCDPDVRAAAVQAMYCVDASHTQQAFEGLVTVLFDSNWMVRQLALRTLNSFAQKDAEFLIHAAKPHLRDQDAMIRMAAVKALGMVKESWMDEDVTLDFKRLMSDSDALVRSEVAGVLEDFAQ